MSAFSSGDGKIPSTKILKLEDGRILDSNPLRNPGLFLIIAPIGSGKTTLILNILMQMTNLYQNAIWCSPNGSLDPLVGKYVKEDSFDFISTAPELHERLGELESINRKKRDANKPIERTLLVMDDTTCDPQFFPHNQKNSLNQRLLSLRHIGLTGVLVFHSYRMAPKVLRLSCSILYLFRCNGLELKAVMEESRLPSDVIQAAYEVATEESPHGFLTIDLKHGRLYSSLERILWELPSKKLKGKAK